MNSKVKPGPVKHPRRVQFKRGVALPPNTKYCGRPSRWGNPIKIGKGITRADALYLHSKLVKAMPAAVRAEFLAPLRGYDLACYCDLGAACHVDLLLRLANQ